MVKTWGAWRRADSTVKLSSLGGGGGVCATCARTHTAAAAQSASPRLSFLILLSSKATSTPLALFLPDVLRRAGARQTAARQVLRAEDDRLQRDRAPRSVAVVERDAHGL